MSRNSFTSTKAEPVKINQVWEYGPAYHRSGRVLVKKAIRSDFFECQEVINGDVRNYTTDDLIQIAAMTAIQPGQQYFDQASKPGRQVCTIKRPIYGTPRDWAFHREGESGETNAGDWEIRRWPLLVGGGSAKSHCPLCGGEGSPTFNMFACKNSACRNFNAVI